MRSVVLGVATLVALPGCGLGLASTEHDVPSDPKPTVALYTYKVSDASGTKVYSEGCAATDDQVSLIGQISATIPLRTEYHIDLGLVAAAYGELTELDQVSYYCNEAERTTRPIVPLAYQDPRCWGGAWEDGEHELLGVDIVAADGKLMELPLVVGGSVPFEIGDVERFRLKSFVPSSVSVRYPVAPCETGYNITTQGRGLITVLPVE